LGNLATPASVQKLQTALHAKAKTEAGYRFYALYDKIYREDILAHAYAQCCSNKGAPGVDGQDFPDIEAYGVQRWLGELAIALKEETYRPDPIRRVFIPKPNGKLRPLGISTLRDRVCMTAAMLVGTARATCQDLSRLIGTDASVSAPPVLSRDGVVVPPARWSRRAGRLCMSRWAA
jgi:RNA-directed DNA polymerase